MIDNFGAIQRKYFLPGIEFTVIGVILKGLVCGTISDREISNLNAGTNVVHSSSSNLEVFPNTFPA